MHAASLALSPKFHEGRAMTGTTEPPSRLAKQLTLAAMSLGYGVVQLDVTIVNTAPEQHGFGAGRRRV
jgi:MFS transporter, DHA2 family, methylenomycin A resistance protein